MPVFHFSAYAIPPAVTAAVLVTFAIAITVTRSSRTSIAMFGVCVAAAAWQVSRVFMYLALAPATALLWARVGGACVAFIAPAAYLFVDTILESATHRKIVSVIARIVAAVFALLAVTTTLFISDVRQFWWGFYPIYNTAARVLYPLFCGGLIAAVFVDIRRAYPSSKGRERSRIRLFAIAMGIGCFAAVDLLPAYGVPVYPFGWAALLAATFVAIYTIEKYGLAITPALPATEIISTMRDLLLVNDRDGRILYANNAACAFLGYSREDIVGLQLEDLLVPRDREEPATLEGWVRDREYVFRTRMGQPIELTLSHSPVTRHGEVTGAVIIGRDLRERKRYEWEARRAVTLLQSTLDSTADGILVIGQDGRVLTWNQRFADMWGIPPESMDDEDQELIGQLVDKLNDPAEFLGNLAELHEHPEVESAHMLQLKDGRHLEQYSIGRYLDDELVRVWSFRDVTARKRAEQQIEFQAYHDALTQLPNRRLFVERLEMNLLAAKRVRANVAVLFIDLDRFKTINDTLGHNVADALLVEIAQRLKSCVRQTDTVARYGGDEFTIILPDLHQPEDAAQVAEKILERVAEPVIVGTTSIEASVSIGIAVHPFDGTDIDTLLRNADDAMYRAKQAGRNNYQLCTEQMKTRAMERSSMQSRLRKAMDDDELVLAYEPQISLSTGLIIGAEAIVRWNDPERGGMIEARDFIPIAEETRLIVPLGEWALFTACRQLRQWADAGLPALRMAVNISARQFQQRDLASVIRRAADEAGINPVSLELEIRETTAMRDIDLTIELLRPLRDAGVSIAIDDFGSSLGSLRVLPVNAVKMDRALLTSVATAEADASIVAAVIGVSRRLRLRVAADGVEKREQFDFLKAHGCQEAQGPYFSAAVDPESFVALTSSGVSS